MEDVPLHLRTALAGRYDIEREAGSGGMATVYLAGDLRHHRQVAVKVLRPDLAASLGAERFLREIRIAAQLSHPHIVPLLDSGEAAGLVYYVMPFVEGESLRSRLEREHALPQEEAVRLLRDVVDALAFAHGHGVVHRDIKPDNVLLSGRHALVTDFGIAKAVSEAGTGTLTAPGCSPGTPAYMAPEQVGADPGTDHRADIYAVGALGYEMLTGTPPFAEPSVQALVVAKLTQQPRPMRDLIPDASPELAALVMRCLETRPEDRYQTADALLADLERLMAPEEDPGVRRTRRRRRAAALVAAGVVVVLAGVVTASTLRRSSRLQWVRAEAVPRLAALADSEAYETAWPIAQRAARLAPHDSLLAPALARVSEVVSIRSQPAGARVFRRALSGPDTGWLSLGITPLDSIRVPFGGWHLRLERQGYRTLEVLKVRPSIATMQFALEATDGPHPGMVLVPGDSVFTLYLPGLEHLTPFLIDSFWIGARETTNREYKAFVDAGGYRSREYWTESFELHGRRVPWQTAMARFVDRTGRPGPSTWQAGDYPEGSGDEPVGGVSWYEAAAYARYAGKSLPTLYHWARAASPVLASYVVPRSNFGGRGPARVGSNQGIGPFGTFDMAGNVREWCLNAAGGTRYILGGGWSDQDYDFNHPTTQPPFDRSAINGIRLASYRPGDTTLAALRRPAARFYPDYSRDRPVGDAVFEVYRRQFDYDPEPLDAHVLARDSTARDYVHETVSFAAPYGGERITAHLLLPRNARPPFQTVVYFPGAFALKDPAFSLDPRSSRFLFLVRTGRAVLYPVYKATFERRDGFEEAPPSRTAAYRDHVVMWVKDFRRSVDYLRTRPDIDSARIAYYGFSWGGYMGGMIPAVEPRLKAQVLEVGGLPYRRGYPEVDPVNYLPRVRIPTLLLGGRQDSYYPYETSQVPFMRLLGASQRRHQVFPGQHAVPQLQLMGETLAWLDRHMGPVQ